MFQLAVDDENSTGYVQLGFWYKYGTEVDKDEKEAVRMFHIAADDKINAGYVQLGLCYKYGTGVGNR